MPRISEKNASTLPTTLDVLVPFWGLAGGVIKVLDYAAHGADLGIAVTLWAPPLPEPDAPVSELPVLRHLVDELRVDVRALSELELTAGDSAVVLFTEPTHYRLIQAALTEPLGANLIHLIQGTRHANPSWQDGLNYRLLHRPMHRIAVTPQVFDAIAPIVNDRYPVTMILEGHDAAFFSGRPEAVPAMQPTPLRVLYATWKSDLGDRVASVLDDDPRFAFIALRREIGWPALRNRYHGADIFLCCPGPEEGFYLPGLEAMAAGNVVVSAPVGGNQSYLQPGKNALLADYGDSLSHVDALGRLADDPELRSRLVAAGHQTVSAHTLERERNDFKAVLTRQHRAAPAAYDTTTDHLED